MCNFAHRDSIVPKKRKGKAWKLFRRTSSGGQLKPLVKGKVYTGAKDGWVQWKSRNPYRDHRGGFCCFPTKKEALKAQKMWLRRTGRGTILRQISYREAFARHIEWNFIPQQGLDVLLVKKFRLIGRETEK